MASLPPPLVQAYLERLDLGAPSTLDRATVVALQHAHLRHIPFENLSIHLGEEIVLDETAIVEKLVLRRRGGFCYELNGGFAALLRALGFTVDLLEGRVHGPPDPTTGERAAGVPYDHLCLRVPTPEGPLLVDVGFGASFDTPLGLDLRGPQLDPNGVFELVARSDGWVDLTRDGTAQFCFDPAPRTALTDCEPGRRHNTTSPHSTFTQRTVCSLPVEGGRITVSNRSLVTTAHGERTETELSDQELLEIYRTRFGLPLDRLPTIP